MKLRYFLKLESNPPGQLVANVHAHRKLQRLPFGFHKDVLEILQKYDIVHVWDQNPESDLDTAKFVERKIFKFHFDRDLNLALENGSVYSRFVLPKLVGSFSHEILEPLKWLSVDGLRDLRAPFLRHITHCRSFKSRCPFCK